MQTEQCEVCEVVKSKAELITALEETMNVAPGCRRATTIVLHRKTGQTRYTVYTWVDSAAEQGRDKEWVHKNNFAHVRKAIGRVRRIAERELLA